MHRPTQILCTAPSLVNCDAHAWIQQLEVYYSYKNLLHLLEQTIKSSRNTFYTEVKKKKKYPKQLSSRQILRVHQVGFKKSDFNIYLTISSLPGPLLRNHCSNGSKLLSGTGRTRSSRPSAQASPTTSVATSPRRAAGRGDKASCSLRVKTRISVVF